MRKQKNTSKEESLFPIAAPSVDSVHVLLKQALHADDQALLLDCLYTRDEKVCFFYFYFTHPSSYLSAYFCC